MDSDRRIAQVKRLDVVDTRGREASEGFTRASVDQPLSHASSHLER